MSSSSGNAMRGGFLPALPGGSGGVLRQAAERWRGAVGRQQRQAGATRQQQPQRNACSSSSSSGATTTAAEHLRGAHRSTAVIHSGRCMTPANTRPRAYVRMSRFDIPAWSGG